MRFSMMFAHSRFPSTTIDVARMFTDTTVVSSCGQVIKTRYLWRCSVVVPVTLLSPRTYNSVGTYPPLFTTREDDVIIRSRGAARTIDLGPQHWRQQSKSVLRCCCSPESELVVRTNTRYTAKKKTCCTVVYFVRRRGFKRTRLFWRSWRLGCILGHQIRNGESRHSRQSRRQSFKAGKPSQILTVPEIFFSRKNVSRVLLESRRKKGRWLYNTALIYGGCCGAGERCERRVLRGAMVDSINISSIVNADTGSPGVHVHIGETAGSEKDGTTGSHDTSGLTLFKVGFSLTDAAAGGVRASVNFVLPAVFYNLSSHWLRQF